MKTITCDNCGKIILSATYARHIKCFTEQIGYDGGRTEWLYEVCIECAEKAENALKSVKEGD